MLHKSFEIILLIRPIGKLDFLSNVDVRICRAGISSVPFTEKTAAGQTDNFMVPYLLPQTVAMALKQPDASW